MRGYNTIENVQSWWEVPCVAHFCSLFRLYFELLDFDIEDLEEALLTDGVEDSGSSLLQDLIVRLLRGCFNSNKDDITTSNYQMYLRRLFRIKCEEDPSKKNPFDGDIAFHSLPLRTKAEILRDICDFRLDSDDVPEALKTLESISLRVDPLGQDSGGSTYWYFYGTRLYREDYTCASTSHSSKKRGRRKHVKPLNPGEKNSNIVTKWQVACFTEEDWQILTQKFKNCKSPHERNLHKTLRDDFLPELPRLFAEKEKLQRKRMLEQQFRRGSRSYVDKSSHDDSSHDVGGAGTSGYSISNGFLSNGKPSRIRNSSTLSLPISRLLVSGASASSSAGPSPRATASATSRRRDDDDNSWRPEEDDDEDDDNNNKNPPVTSKKASMDDHVEEEHEEKISSADEEELRRKREEQEKADRLLAEAMQREERKARLHLRERRGTSGTAFCAPSSSSRAPVYVPDRPLLASSKTVSKQTVAAAVSKKNCKASPVKSSPVKKSTGGKKSSSKKAGGSGRMTNNSLSVSLSPLVEHEDGEDADDDDDEDERHSDSDDSDDDAPEKKKSKLSKSAKSSKKPSKTKKKKKHPSSSPSSSRSPSPSSSASKKVKKSKSSSSSSSSSKKRTGSQVDGEENRLGAEQDEHPDEEADYEEIVSRTLHSSSSGNKKASTSEKGKSKGGKEKGKGKDNEKVKGKEKKQRESSSKGGKGKERKSKKSTKKKDKDKEKESAKRSKSPAEPFPSGSTCLIGASTVTPGGGTSKTKVKSSVLFSQTEEDVQIGMHKVVESIKNHRDAWPFLNPVDEDYAPNYYRIIDSPMDLQTMEDKLDNQEYSSLEEFMSDFERIVDNCRKYNGPSSEYTEMVETVEDAFTKLVQRYITPDESDEDISIEYANTSSDRKRSKPSSSATAGPSTSQSKKKEGSSKSEKKEEGDQANPPESGVESDKDDAKKKRTPSSDELPSCSMSNKLVKQLSNINKYLVNKEKEEKSGGSSKKSKKSKTSSKSKRRSHGDNDESEERDRPDSDKDDGERVKQRKSKGSKKSFPTDDKSGEKSPKKSSGKKRRLSDDEGDDEDSNSAKVANTHSKPVPVGTPSKKTDSLKTNKKMRTTHFPMDEDDEYNIDRDLSPPPPKVSKKEEKGKGKGKSKDGKGKKGSHGKGDGEEKVKEKGKKHHKHHHSRHIDEMSKLDESMKASSGVVVGKSKSTIKSTSSSASSVSSMSTTSSSLYKHPHPKSKGKGSKDGSKGSSSDEKNGKSNKRTAAAGNNLLNTLKNSAAFKRMNQMSRVAKTSLSSDGKSKSDSMPLPPISQPVTKPTSGSLSDSSAGTVSIAPIVCPTTSNGAVVTGGVKDAAANGGSSGPNSVATSGTTEKGAIGVGPIEKKKCLLINDMSEDKVGAPKLSLGSVLTTDAIKLNPKVEVVSEDEEVPPPPPPPPKSEVEEPVVEEKLVEIKQEEEPEEEMEEDYEINRKLDHNRGFNRDRCLPNLSAWIKAFGGPTKGSASGSPLSPSHPSSSAVASALPSPVKKPDPESKNKFRVMGRGVGETDSPKPTSHASSSKVASHTSVIKGGVASATTVITPTPSTTRAAGHMDGPSWNPVTGPTPPMSNPMLNPIKQAALEQQARNSASLTGEDLSTADSHSHSHHSHHLSKKHRNRKRSSSSLSSQSESGSPLFVSSHDPGSTVSGIGGGFISSGSVVNPPRWVDDHWGQSQSQSPSASSHVSSQSPAGPNSPFSPTINSPPHTPQTPPRPPAAVRVGFYQDITSQHSSPDKVNEASPSTPPTPSSVHGSGGTSSNRRGGRDSSSSSNSGGASNTKSSSYISSSYPTPLYAPKYVASALSPNLGPGSNASSSGMPSPSPSSGGIASSAASPGNPNSPHSPKVVNMSSNSSSAADYRSHSLGGSGNSSSTPTTSSSSNRPQTPAHQQSSRPSSVLHAYTPPPHYAHGGSLIIEQHLRGSSGQLPEAHNHSSSSGHHHHHHHHHSSSHHHQTPAHAHSNSTTSHAHSHHTHHLGQPQQAHASNQYDSSSRYPPNLPHAHQQSSTSSSIAVSSHLSNSSSSTTSTSSSSYGAAHQNLAQAHAHSRQSTTSLPPTTQPHLSHPYPSNPYASNPRSINVAPNVYNNPITADPAMTRYYKAAMAAAVAGNSELSLTIVNSGVNSDQRHTTHTTSSTTSTSSSSSKRSSRSNASANAVVPTDHLTHELARSVTPAAAAAVAAALEGKLGPGDLNGFHWPHNLASLSQIVNSIPNAMGSMASAYRHYDPASMTAESMSKYQRAAAAAAAAAAESNSYPTTTSTGSGGSSSSGGVITSASAVKLALSSGGSGSSHGSHHHSSSSSHADKGDSQHDSLPNPPTSSSKKQSKSEGRKERSQNSSSKSLVSGSAFNYSSLTPDLTLYTKEMSESSLYSASPPTLTPPLAHRPEFYPTSSSSFHSTFSAAARTTAGGVPTPPITPYQIPPFIGSHPSPYQSQPVSSQPFAAHSQSSRGLSVDPYQQLFQGSPHVMGLLPHTGYPAPYAHPHSSLGFNRPGWI